MSFKCVSLSFCNTSRVCCSTSREILYVDHLSFFWTLVYSYENIPHENTCEVLTLMNLIKESKSICFENVACEMFRTQNVCKIDSNDSLSSRVILPTRVNVVIL